MPTTKVSISDRRYHPHPHAEGIDLVALEASLRSSVRGEVRFDRGSRAAYATDGSNFRQPPLAVVVPHDVADVVAAVEACRAHGAPITHRGGGTSLAGQGTNVAVIVDTSKYVNRVLEIDPEERWARVEPGCVLDDLRDRAEEHGLTFGPDPSTHNRCTLGGMIGNNSCGVHSVMAGRTSDNVESLDVLLYDGTRLTVGPTDGEELERIVAEGGRRGEIYAGLRDLRDRHADEIRRRYPDIPRRVSGYNLDDLLPENGFNVARALTGTEGTCVTVLEAKLRLVPSPPARSLVVLGYHHIAEAGDHVPEIMRHAPTGLEGIDRRLVSNMHRKGLRASDLSLMPNGDDFLLVEFGGDTKEESDAKARRLMEELSTDQDVPQMSLFDDADQEEKLWEVREAGLGATARVPGHPDTWPGWEDSAVPPEKVGDYLRDLLDLYERFGYEPAVYGHFGQGCIHCRVPFNLWTQPGIAKYRSFLDEAADLVLGYGGSLSGEHGDGQQRGPLLEKMFGPELVEAFTRFQALWDPTDRMNPGKTVDPIRRFGEDENLRLGADYHPWTPQTTFSFHEDDGSMVRATERCVGVGKCRRESGDGVMCPSYMVTKEEEHSTRGRSRILFEMLQGDVITDGWRSQEVFDALDLCLSCKGCKADCPVNVDMATYKAEFLSHHYKRRLRPRYAYAMGLIMFAARLGSKVPRLANLALTAPGVSTALKKLGGVAPERPAPTFAHQSFRAWFEARERRNEGKPPVLLFPDTFTNFWHVDVAKACVDVLEAAGFEVLIPPKVLCCGRPLFDYGMLDTAQKLFLETLDTLRPFIADGVPMVVPEPSCCAAFRDELVGLFPHNQDALRLHDQTHTLGEFLHVHAPDWEPPKVDRQVTMWRHCHHHSVMGMGGEESVLERMGVELDTPGSGCCGLAGSWGFEADKFDLSMQCGELSLFPTARDAGDEAVIVADGFSCRTQLEHGTDRRAIHLAQLLQAHLPGTGKGLPDRRPESAFE